LTPSAIGLRFQFRRKSSTSRKRRSAATSLEHDMAAKRQRHWFAQVISKGPTARGTHGEAEFMRAKLDHSSAKAFVEFIPIRSLNDCQMSGPLGGHNESQI
jgi:hypothetical protein